MKIFKTMLDWLSRKLGKVANTRKVSFRENRFILEITDEGKKKLLVAMEKTGLSTHWELGNYAYSIFLWCVNEISEGRVIVSIDEETGEQKELDTVIFDTVRGRKQEDPEKKKTKLFLIYKKDDSIAPE